MKEFEYKINIRIKNSKPVPIQNLSQFFSALENEYNNGLEKNFILKLPDASTRLAISEVKQGSQIFTIVALVAADCLFPIYNEEILVPFFDYINTLFQDFKNNKQLEKYNKKNCKNVKDASEIFTNDFNLSLEMSVAKRNNEIKKIEFSNKQGNTIYNNASAQLQLLNTTKRDAFTDKLMYFHQTQNTTKSAGDRVIIKEFNEKPKKIEFATPTLKHSVIGRNDNFYKNLYRASGYINYKDGKVQSYTVTKIDTIKKERK